MSEQNRYTTTYNHIITSLIRGLTHILIVPQYQCQAKCVMNDVQCTTLTRHKYCPDHERIRIEFHRLYHLYDLRFRYIHHMQLEHLIECELQLRAQYQSMFNLPFHLGHHVWENFLRLEATRATRTYSPPNNTPYLPCYTSYHIFKWHAKTHLDVEVTFHKSRSIYCPLHSRTSINATPRVHTMLRIYFEDYIWDTYHQLTTIINALDLQLPPGRIETSYFVTTKTDTSSYPTFTNSFSHDDNRSDSLW